MIERTFGKDEWNQKRQQMRVKLIEGIGKEDFTRDRFIRKVTDLFRE